MLGTRVVFVNYAVETVQRGLYPSSREVTAIDCEIRVEGHPTNALQLAYDTAVILVGKLEKPWGFKSIKFDKMGEYNSDWLCTVKVKLNG
jgi:hypothetical protein